MTASLLQDVRAAGEDFEWYPTTDRMIDAVVRWIDKTAKSVMDIGAGDGRVLRRLAAVFEHEPQLFAIEKSNVLIQAQPENVIPVGTDLFEQNLACLPVDYIFCNPPYSAFELWATVIIESGHARKAFLVIPQRWKGDASIADALKKRGATARVIHSDHFLDAERRARAVVDIVEVSYPMKEGRGWRSDREVQDPFDIWFDEHITTFDEEVEGDTSSKYEIEQQALARIRHLETITDMVESYTEEHARMEENYRAIFHLDYALLRELGVNKAAVRDGLKAKMAGLKSKYWTLLFERLDTITERLSTATKAKFLERLTGRTALAFTANNAYAVVLWSIKNANKYFDEQAVKLYRDLSTHEGVLRYKSNVRTWQKNDWRYSKHWDEEDRRPTHYALDYRIVIDGHSAIGTGESWQYDYPGNLHKGKHELIADIIAVLYNLGWQARGTRSTDRTWFSGEWQNWYQPNSTAVLFQVKAFKNGNVHMRFAPDAIKALNVEAGRLLGWLPSAEAVESELGYTAEEARRFFASTKMLTPRSVRLLEGA